MKKSDRVIILTGAGFTSNFGGFLGIEMWNKIFNMLPNNSALKERFLAGMFNFEEIYSNILEDVSFTDEQKDTTREIIFDVYKEMDESIKERINNNVDNILIQKIPLLYRREGDSAQYFFTLNQDLFLERRLDWHYSWAGLHPHIIRDKIPWDFSKSEFIKLPGEEEMELARKKIIQQGSVLYVKLHGSYGWKSCSREDHSIILGINKEKDIEKEPILKWYFDMLKEAIAEGNKKMLIIGYGFKDNHINKILLDGIKKHNLSLYLITLQKPQDLMLDLQNNYSFYEYVKNEYSYKYPGSYIWLGIKGYFQYQLKDIFPSHIQESILFKEIKQAMLKD